MPFDRSSVGDVPAVLWVGFEPVGSKNSADLEVELSTAIAAALPAGRLVVADPKIRKFQTLTMRV